MIPNLAGQVISKIQIDFMLRLWTEGGWQFNLEGDVYLSEAGRQTKLLDTQTTSQDAMEDLLPFVGATIVEVLVAAEGHLAINLGGVQISCQVVPQYESWQLHGPNGEIAVCLPGGKLSTWGPRV